MTLIDRYIGYISSMRRYSPRTCAVYADVLGRFVSRCCVSGGDSDIIAGLTPDSVRNYMVWLMDELGESPRTVNLHLSVLGGFCRYLCSENLLKINPVRAVARPKTPKRLPSVYKEEEMRKYFSDTECRASAGSADLVTGSDPASVEIWTSRRNRLAIRLLFDTGMRRAELISLNISSVDFRRGVVRVHGKGNKTREIPMLSGLSEEISLYLVVTEKVLGGVRDDSEPLLVTAKGSRLYPMAVERIVREELGEAGITGRKSPHSLRHTLATELLDGGSDLNSIKELLGHSSLAATQVYTHTSVEKLKQSYNNAHPRAKRRS